MAAMFVRSRAAMTLEVKLKLVVVVVGRRRAERNYTRSHRLCCASDEVDAADDPSMMMAAERALKWPRPPERSLPHRSCSSEAARMTHRRRTLRADVDAAAAAAAV